MRVVFFFGSGAGLRFLSALSGLLSGLCAVACRGLQLAPAIRGPILYSALVSCDPACAPRLAPAGPEWSGPGRSCGVAAGRSPGLACGLSCVLFRGPRAPRADLLHAAAGEKRFRKKGSGLAEVIYLSYICTRNKQGSLAQLVQSVCLTSRGSGVRIPQLPQHRKENRPLERVVFFVFGERPQTAFVWALGENKRHRPIDFLCDVVVIDRAARDQRAERS